MTKVSVLYPEGEGKKFNVQYYCEKHIPMVRQKCGTACKRVEVDLGLGGAQPGSADIPNYTDIQPVIQISDVKL